MRNKLRQEYCFVCLSNPDGEGYLLLKYAVTIFLTDIVIRVFVNPNFLLFNNRAFDCQEPKPEYVGAQQKSLRIIGVFYGNNIHSPVVFI